MLGKKDIVVSGPTPMIIAWLGSRAPTRLFNPSATRIDRD